ncbi:hypothetical protein P9272_03015 [Mesorhizobium sp. WSM4976]|uniref:hypothetical protein n=1 Tax=Mesorhizobium sp. WSM4976 TaxID=3038549 RepID=UPI0024160156|nr:hypothetical protein [Mesorhizobium sp. WSM4976]MDG4892567.1 hypothetical protein [Mesorhizobium sp. WSM4976]
MIREALDAWDRQSLTAPVAERHHGAHTCVRLAIAHALHVVVGLPMADSAAIASGSWQVVASLLKIVEFHPLRVNGGARQDGVGMDPLMLFAPHAAEAIPVAAVDEYLDVVDGRRVYWRKPRRDSYALACELHRLSCVTSLEDEPALLEEYLELLASLRAPADHVCEWIGTVAEGRFRPAPDRCAEGSQAMRQGPASTLRAGDFVDNYASTVSVNVSLAARLMKRRALGLPVTEPLPGKNSTGVERRTMR